MEGQIFGVAQLLPQLHHRLPTTCQLFLQRGYPQAPAGVGCHASHHAPFHVESGAVRGVCGPVHGLVVRLEDLHPQRLRHAPQQCLLDGSLGGLNACLLYTSPSPRDRG